MAAASESQSKLLAALDIMQRMPPSKIEQSLTGLLNLIPEETDELLQARAICMCIKKDTTLIFIHFSLKEGLIKKGSAACCLFGVHMSRAVSFVSYTQRIDQPLSEEKCPKTGRKFLLCDYNRDGDSFR